MLGPCQYGCYIWVEFAMKTDYAKFLKHMLFLIMVVTVTGFLLSCGGSSNSNNGLQGNSASVDDEPFTNAITMGVLPNGSDVWVSAETFSVPQTQSTTGVIGLVDGAAGVGYKLSFTVESVPGEQVNSLPGITCVGGCVVTSGGAPVTIHINTTGSTSIGTYKVWVAGTSMDGTNSTTLSNTFTIIVGNAGAIASGNLTFSPVSKADVIKGGVGSIVVSLSNSVGPITPNVVTVSSSNPQVMTVSPSVCSLTPNANYCIITLNSIAIGSATVMLASPVTPISSASLEHANTVQEASTSESQTSEKIENAAAHVVFNDTNGLVYRDHQLVIDETSLVPIQPATIYSNNNIASDGSNLYIGSGAEVLSVSGSQGQIIGEPGGNDFDVVGQLVVDQAGQLYATTQGDGLFQYKSGSWAQVTTFAGFPQAITVDESNNVYAAIAGSGVQKWSPHKSQLTNVCEFNASPLYGMSIDAVAVNSKNGNVYVLSSNYSGASKIWQCTPASSIWTQIGGIDTNPILTDIAVDNADNKYVLTTNGHVWQITAQGTSSRLESAPDGRKIVSIVIDGSGNLYAGTTYGDVYQYSNSIWNILYSRVSKYGIYDLATDVAGNVYVETGSGGVRQFNPKLRVWNNLPYQDIMSAITIDASGNIYSGSATGRVWQYAKNGHTWLPMPKPESLAISVIAVDQSGDIFTGDNAGNLWQYINGSWSQPNFTCDGRPQALVTALASTSNNYVYVGFSTPPASELEYEGACIAYYSPNHGWAGNFHLAQFLPYYGNSNIDPPPLVSSFAYDSSTQQVYAGTNQGVYEYTGGNWIANSYGTVSGVASDSQGNLYAALGGHMVVFSDLGKKSNNIKNQYATHVAADDLGDVYVISGSTVYLGLSNSGGITEFTQQNDYATKSNASITNFVTAP